MIYRDRMISVSDFQHNFYIFRLAMFLYHLRVIPWEEVMEHMITMDNSRPVGIKINYDKFIVEGPDETYKF